MAGNIDIRTKVGLRIKELRLESGMSQEDLETLRGLLIEHIGKRFHQYAK